MIRTTMAAAAPLAALAAVGLSACSYMGARSATDSVHNSATFENQNARDQNSNGSVQPGGAGPSPNGGVSNPGTSGSVSARPHEQSSPH